MDKKGCLTSEEDALMRQMLARMDTPEFRKKMDESFREQSVPEDGICRATECGGRVVRAVRSLSSSGYGYDTPCCEKCGRHYPFGDSGHAAVVGMKAFQKMLDTPYDI